MIYWTQSGFHQGDYDLLVVHGPSSVVWGSWQEVKSSKTLTCTTECTICSASSALLIVGKMTFAEGFGNFLWEQDWQHTRQHRLLTRCLRIGIESGCAQAIKRDPQSTEYLHIRFMPLTIELLLVDVMNEPVCYDLKRGSIIALNTGTTWSIMNVQVKCDLVTLDGG